MAHPFIRSARLVAFAFGLLGITVSGAAAQTAPAPTIGSGVIERAVSGAFSTERITSGFATQASGSSDTGWKVGIYPILVWVPTNIDIDIELPPDSGGDAGKIIDSRFDGAYMGGFYAGKAWFRMDGDGVWAGIGGDRPQPPLLTVDVDLIYFHASGGVRVAPGLYATAGVRRLALKYNVRFGDYPEFERKPGIWDPVIGVGYHYEGAGRPFEFHTTFEGGGFGVGSDQEWAWMSRIDWKPISHFGLTGGYNFLYYKFTNTLLNRDFTVRQSVHGPIVGFGLYF